MSLYNIVIASPDSTVVTAYTPAVRERPESYQSEAEMERELIAQLCTQGYEYLPIRDEQALVDNLRRQLELLNQVSLSDTEWQRFFAGQIANQADSVVDRTRTIQRDHVKVLTRDDGSSKNITLIDKKQIHNNRVQVINQYATSAGKRASRYDVTILVNGLPLVHIELKRRGVAIKQAFNQIERYNRESFWHASGLFEYVQLYIISNGTSTKYYSNTTRERSIVERQRGGQAPARKSSHSFEFTSFWADASNKRIEDIVDVTATLLSKHTLLNVLTKYCVLDSDNQLLVMRPYQIVATERILKKIEIAHQYHKAGTLDAGGYIWHTTGSGKTLTSFKVAQLASELPSVDKVLFVVDRKDLDYQTIKEYDRFEQGAANSNRSTRVLERQLSDSTSRIIVTTIQKLDTFVDRHKGHAVFGKRVVLIFDECHRSQFGDMHKAITRSFRHYYLFGFTGTPIFAANASSQNAAVRTTTQVFGDRLHAYTIVDAINDENVLPFRVDYINTVKAKADLPDTPVSAIDTERAMADPVRIREVVQYILTHFDQKTIRHGNAGYYQLNQKRLNGFNSLFAVSSIPQAMRYYHEFGRQLQANGRTLKVAVIFSYGANEQAEDVFLDDEELDTTNLNPSYRDFLEQAIATYNTMFGTNHSTSADRFENYYKDVSQRMKQREIDVLIVVNMFLTGFDATTLNTLWVDKNLRQHGLIQAFSRTNRILNDVKKFGNIVCFRNLQDEVDDAIALFGNKEARSIVLLKNFEAYYYGYHDNGKAQPGYTDMVAALRSEYPLGEPIMGEQHKKDFITLFGAVLRRRNILTAFDQFADLELLSERDLQDYQSRYIDLYDDYRRTHEPEKASINDDLVFELELVRQVAIGIDYILALVAKYKQTHGDDQRVVADGIAKAIGASMQMRSKKELIELFIAMVSETSDVVGAWHAFVHDQKERELAEIIASEQLKPDDTRRLIANAFEAGALKTTGVDVDRILPVMSRFDAARHHKKQQVIERLLRYFDKFYGV